MNRLMSMGVVILAILAMAAPVAAAQRPIVLEFQKTGADGHYLGTIEGGGSIEMQLFDSRVIGNTQHFSAYVEVEGSSAGSFTAVVSGKINFTTGSVVLNGTVTDGDYEGAQVREESQLIWETGAFEGSVQIMPAS